MIGGPVHVVSTLACSVSEASTEAPMVPMVLGSQTSVVVPSGFVVIESGATDAEPGT